jgi:hypothetical protein
MDLMQDFGEVLRLLDTHRVFGAHAVCTCMRQLDRGALTESCTFARESLRCKFGS